MPIIIIRITSEKDVYRILEYKKGGVISVDILKH